MMIDEKILGMTTIVKSASIADKCGSLGSGFFYTELAEEQTEQTDKGSGWRKIESIWLITNRHVVFPHILQADGSKKEMVPDVLEFNMREQEESGIEWVPIQLPKNELLKRTKLHPDPQIDVVAIRIDDLQIKLIQNNPNRNIIGGFRLTNDNLPSAKQPAIETTSDVVICSYPYAFYDKVNKFPIIKSGIVASSWGANFNGLPYFLVDAKLFHGSSGGLVISKPTDMAIIGGQLMKSKEKQYVFLGIYSGEYSHNVQDPSGKINKEYFGLGIVWYSYLVPQIINEGIQYNI